MPYIAKFSFVVIHLNLAACTGGLTSNPPELDTSTKSEQNSSTSSNSEIVSLRIPLPDIDELEDEEKRQDSKVNRVDRYITGYHIAVTPTSRCDSNDFSEADYYPSDNQVLIKLDSTCDYEILVELGTLGGKSRLTEMRLAKQSPTSGNKALKLQDEDEDEDEDEDIDSPLETVFYRNGRGWPITSDDLTIADRFLARFASTADAEEAGFVTTLINMGAGASSDD